MNTNTTNSSIHSAPHYEYRKAQTLGRRHKTLRFHGGNYLSANEENFFKNMQYKQEYEATALNDLIVSEYENDDEIYIVRMYNEEYVVGRGIDTDGAFEEHVMCLSDALALNLKTLGYVEGDITLWEWMRKCDYTVVKYERNYDILENGKWD